MHIQKLAYIQRSDILALLTLLHDHNAVRLNSIGRHKDEVFTSNANHALHFFFVYVAFV